MTIERLRQYPKSVLIAARCTQSFHYFFRTFWPVLHQGGELQENWHIGYLCHELQRVGEQVLAGEEYDHNLTINISPGETKSTITTIMFPAWLWCRDPSLRILTASYSQSLAIAHSTASRDIIESELYRACFPEVEIRRDMAAKTTYGSTAGGQRFVASTGSTVTGKHAHIIIVDDPINVEQAMSEAERATANRWLSTTLPSRKVDLKTAPTILIMQRLHEEDPTAEMGRIWEAQKKYKHICLPADDRYEVKPAVLKKRYKKDGAYRVMNPVRRGTSVLKKIEAVSLQMYAGQFGQAPAPAEGNKLKKAWFKQRISLEEVEAMGGSVEWKTTVDGAYTKNKKNSGSGALTFCIIDDNLYLRDWMHVWLEFPEFCDELTAFCNRTGAGGFNGIVHVEPKATGKSVVQQLRRDTGLNIIENELPEGVTTQQGKEMRVDKITNYVRGMNVYLIKGTDWQPFIDNMAVFPAGSHDDLVDCFVMACEKVQNSYDASAWDFYTKR